VKTLRHSRGGSGSVYGDNSSSTSSMVSGVSSGYHSASASLRQQTSFASSASEAIRSGIEVMRSARLLVFHMPWHAHMTLSCCRRDKRQTSSKSESEVGEVKDEYCEEEDASLVIAPSAAHDASQGRLRPQEEEDEEKPENLSVHDAQETASQVNSEEGQQQVARTRRDSKGDRDHEGHGELL